MNSTKIVTAVTFVLAILLSAGCTMKWKAYPDPELPKEKIAIIKPEQTFFGTIGVTKVDGKKPEKNTCKVK